MFPTSVVYYRFFPDGMFTLTRIATLGLSDCLQWYMIDSVGRRRLFIMMAIGMCVVLICEAITVAIDNKPSGIAAVFFVFAFEACFTWGKLHSRCFSQTPHICMWTSADNTFHRVDGHGMGLSCRDSPAEDPIQGCCTSCSSRLSWKFLGRFLSRHKM